MVCCDTVVCQYNDNGVFRQYCQFDVDTSPYIFNEQMHTVSAYSQEEMIVIQLNEEHTFIVSYTIIH